MLITSLPLDLWYEVFGLLDIDEAIAVSKASPRLFGAFIESKQGIRFRNSEMLAEDGSVSSVSWILLYRSSISGFRAADFHQACDGTGKCVVVVKAANGRMAAAYNEVLLLSLKSLPISMALLHLSLMMEDVETYSIEMIMKWESGIILMLVLGLGMISLSQTTVT
jgi:hypothetical protein